VPLLPLSTFFSQIYVESDNIIGTAKNHSRSHHWMGTGNLYSSSGCLSFGKAASHWIGITRGFLDPYPTFDFIHSKEGAFPAVRRREVYLGSRSIEHITKGNKLTGH
jgi:hypothetical protein